MGKMKQSMEELLEEALVPEEEQPYDIPENWVWVLFDKVVRNITNGKKQIPQKHYQESGILPVVDQGQKLISGYTDNLELRFSGELPVIIFGDHTKCIKWVDFDFVQGADGTKILKPLEPIYPKYLYYLLKVVKLPDKGYSRHFKYLKNKPLPIAPVSEQKRIAEKIERLFAKIDEAKRLIEEVKESFEIRRAAILDKAFKGQLGTNNPNEQSMLKTPNAIKEKDLIPKEEQPFEVPDNWVWVRFSSFLPPMETRDPSELESENFLYVDIDSIDNDIFEIREPKILNIENAPSRAKRKIEKGDVIISLVRPYLRNVARVLSDDPRLVASTAFYVCKKNKVTQTNYLFHYLITPFVTNYLNVRTKGHNAPSVRNSDFLEVPIPIPPAEEQKRIAEKVEKLLSKLDNEKEMVLEVEQKLDLIKQSILNKAFRGELGTNDPTEESAIELLKEVLQSK